MKACNLPGLRIEEMFCGAEKVDMVGRCEVTDLETSGLENERDIVDEVEVWEELVGGDMLTISNMELSKEGGSDAFLLDRVTTGGLTGVP